MKSNRIKIWGQFSIAALIAVAALLACSCSASRAQSESQQTTATAKAKQPSKMLVGAKYVTNDERTPVSPSQKKIQSYHKARKFGDTGKMLQIEQEGVQNMELLPKGTIVIMESPGSLYSLVRLENGRAGYIENENITFLSE